MVPFDALNSLVDNLTHLSRIYFILVLRSNNESAVKIISLLFVMVASCADRSSFSIADVSGTAAAPVGWRFQI